MAATFVLEDGTGKSDSNAYISVADADQYHENFGNPSSWSSATNEEKEDAIRKATRYLDLQYVWDGYKVYSTQALKWPRYETYDEDLNVMDSDSVPIKVQEACAYLALKVIDGDTLIEDQDNKSKVKRTKDVVGPLTEEREYLGGESPEKTYTIADNLVSSFLIAGNDGFSIADIERG